MEEKAPRQIYKASCPTCGVLFTVDEWQLEDGPCMNGKFYCLKKFCPCGCNPPRVEKVTHQTL
jgi:hypothetical protein